MGDRTCHPRHPYNQVTARKRPGHPCYHGNVRRQPMIVGKEQTWEMMGNVTLHLIYKTSETMDSLRNQWLSLHDSGF